MQLSYYQSPAGRRPFVEWLVQLGESMASARVQARLARVASGNLGDIRALGEGVMEMRIDFGPGYRLYFAIASRTVLLLLCGGDKSSQEKDIQRAKGYFQDFKTRSAASRR